MHEAITIVVPVSEIIKSRFFAKLEKTDSCWLWTGYKSPKGYGLLSVLKKHQIRAHRLSWAIHNGEIPNGLHVLHSCDVRHCVNPAHLWLGTNDDNVADMIAKGRKPCGKEWSEVMMPHINRGEKHPCAKLTASQVLDIRASTESIKTLSDNFNISQKMIRNIIERRYWKHI